MRPATARPSVVTFLVLVVAACTAPPPTPTPTATDGQASPIAGSCERLAEVELEEVTAITARLVPSGSLPEHCRVALTVERAINIELWLPTDQYNHRFQAMGGGGFDGQINTGSMTDALRDGYATASTDGGHAGTDVDGSFALTADGTLDLPLIEDFASRALIELTEKSGLLIEAFYGEPAEYRYWNGCSTGGREGLMLAQRHPEGYDGILAGAPAINWDRFVPALLWPQVVMDEQLGHPIEACKLAEATDAAVAACDTLDGVDDGVLDDPRACDFDAASLLGMDTPCGVFTEADAAVIQSIWDGPSASDGRFLWYGLAPGAPLDALAEGVHPIGESYHRHWIQQDPGFDWHTLGAEGFEDAYRTSQELFHDVIGTDDPDLSPFRDAGGKLLMWHGWGDPEIVPEGSIDYYQRVLDTMGDPQDVAAFARLFMVPGMFHCEGGPGLTTFDAFDALVDWVESGLAPEAITASRSEGGAVVATRPLCPYPAVASYDGTGNPAQAASFDCSRR